MRNFAAEFFLRTFFPVWLFILLICASAFPRERLFISLSCAIKNNQRQGEVALEEQQKDRRTRDATEGEVNNSIILTECNIIRAN